MSIVLKFAVRACLHIVRACLLVSTHASHHGAPRQRQELRGKELPSMAVDPAVPHNRIWGTAGDLVAGLPTNTSFMVSRFVEKFGHKSR